MQGLVASSAFLSDSASLAYAEEAEGREVTADPNQVVEEVVVIGRYRAAATDIVSERIESDVPMDFLDAEGISRVGDSNVAAALAPVPGVTLVQNQFIYVRGLGERYSSSQLNGSGIPSPDLTRNVLPLDISSRRRSSSPCPSRKATRQNCRRPSVAVTSTSAPGPSRKTASSASS